MFDAISTMNWLGVIVAFLPYFFLGALWFTVLFKKRYAISLGKENELPKKVAPIFIIGPAICTFAITVATAILINALHINSYENALLFSLVIGFGYLVANTVNIAINPNIPKPIFYSAISGSYHLVGILIACIVLVSMK